MLKLEKSESSKWLHQSLVKIKGKRSNGNFKLGNSKLSDGNRRKSLFTI